MKDQLNTGLGLIRLISGGENLMIEALDGKACLFDAKKMFQSYIDGDFEKWQLNKPGKATLEIFTDVYEWVPEGTFAEVFTSISSDLEKIVMTQNQILWFCEKHRTWLRQEGYGTFFLIKENGEYFVVDVGSIFQSLGIAVMRLGCDCDGIERVRCRYRIVIPRLTLAA